MENQKEQSNFQEHNNEEITGTGDVKKKRSILIIVLSIIGFVILIGTVLMLLKLGVIGGGEESAVLDRLNTKSGSVNSENKFLKIKECENDLSLRNMCYFYNAVKSKDINYCYAVYQGKYFEVCAEKLGIISNDSSFCKYGFGKENQDMFGYCVEKVEIYNSDLCLNVDCNNRRKILPEEIGCCVNIYCPPNKYQECIDKYGSIFRNPEQEIAMIDDFTVFEELMNSKESLSYQDICNKFSGWTVPMCFKELAIKNRDTKICEFIPEDLEYRHEWDWVGERREYNVVRNPVNRIDNPFIDKYRDSCLMATIFEAKVSMNAGVAPDYTVDDLEKCDKFLKPDACKAELYRQLAIDNKESEYCDKISQLDVDLVNYNDYNFFGGCMNEAEKDIMEKAETDLNVKICEKYGESNPLFLKTVEGYSAMDRCAQNIFRAHFRKVLKEASEDGNNGHFLRPEQVTDEIRRNCVLMHYIFDNYDVSDVRDNKVLLNNCVKAGVTNEEAMKDLPLIEKELEAEDINIKESVNDDPNQDLDNDGLSDLDEETYGTDKNNPDTDGDGYSDGNEVKNGFNPNGDGKLGEYK